ncbi:putative RNA-binding protein C25G10,01 OS=Schizosaccharomyces pombe (strain 972 / ATCC 24843) GN=SPAC25G10.01 PE=1 SV=1 [Rhizoctonia solani AG-1 IB]|uniref:Putative RNA-binding protein C25G10,01 n=1 Tax=Thanatephorus cucumeris (strain AG1-IB / isolate 7/3/14) TaxID=1108050 RepID=A0A0B7FGT1_THACB|nr:putative RNA-binding protein C25G10,01 OS=Schizosaccharomyces pombe (strain 972 / ATCC 24843) GN=SPAC25G10.01 PE=1 SV=1 [Rhizoctonia solani AG-1 IB]
MNDAWADSTDTTPVTAADGWEKTTGGQSDPGPYVESNESAPAVVRDSRRSRSRSPIRNGTDRRGRDDSNNPGTNLHISGLHPRVTDRQLEDVFAKYGQVEKAQVVCDPHTRDSRGFAFVLMRTLEEAEAAITGLNGYVLENSALRVEKARRGRARTPTPGKYVGPSKYSERPYAPREYDDYRYRRGGGYDDYYDRGFDRRRSYDEDRYGGDRYGGRYERYGSSRSRWDDRDYRGYERDYDYERGSRYNRGGRDDYWRR